MEPEKQEFQVKMVEISKLKKPFCQVCGKWAKEKVEDKNKEVEQLAEIWLSEGAIPFLRGCVSCLMNLSKVLEETLVIKV